MSELTIEDVAGSVIAEVTNNGSAVAVPTNDPEPSSNPEPSSPSEGQSEGPTTNSQEPQPTVNGAESAAVTVTEPVNTYAAELQAAEDKLRSLLTPPNLIPPWLRVHVYGRPGSGKTVFGAASGLKTLFIDIEEGAVSLNNHPELKPLVQVMPFQSFRQMQVLAEVLQNGGMPEFQVIQFDTWSELAKDELGNAYEGNKNNPRAGRIHPEIEAGLDYQVANKHMERLALSLRGLDRHLVFVSHMKEDKDKQGNVFRIRPNLSPGLLNVMDAFVHVTGYMNAEFQGTKGMVRYLQPHPDAIIDAKTRIGGLPAQIMNPTFADLLAANERMRSQ